MQITQPVKTLSKHFNTENSIFDRKGVVPVKL